MQKISVQIQAKIKTLRISGFTHRQIAKILHIGQGTVASYTRGIYLTRQQKIRLNKKNYINSLGKLTAEQRREASIKGGRNTTSHFPIKYSSKDLILSLKNFYRKNRRIPTKRDFVALYRPILRVFKTWNNAIKKAGFSPNPVLFAKKYVANDGHRCDSLAEKIIDDWLTARKIVHERNIPYFNTRFTADFKIGDIFVEFFGLHGQLKRYDFLMQKKLRLIQKYKLKLISLYPEDIFPSVKLQEKLKYIV